MAYTTVMDRKNVENVDGNRVKNFGGMMDAKLVDSFVATIPLNSVGQPKYKKKHVLAYAMKVWIDLPPEIRNKLMMEELAGDTLIALINQILDQRIEEGRKAARSLAVPHKGKPGQKGQSS